MENAVALLALLASYTSCLRCRGTGRVVGFSHVLGGVCFACDGAERRRVFNVHKAREAELPADVEGALEGLGFVEGYELKQLTGKKYKALGYFADCGHGQWLSYSKKTGIKIYGAANVREAAAFSGFLN